MSSDGTLQQSGLAQNQPSIRPPQQGLTVESNGPGGILGGRARSATGAIIGANEPGGFNYVGPSAPIAQEAPRPAPTGPVGGGPASVPSSSAPAPGMDYLEGVRSRSERGMDRSLAAVEAALKKRGLNTSGIGQNLTNIARSDLRQQADEQVSQAAWEQYQLQQQQAHQTALQNLVGQQALSQATHQTNEGLRGAQAAIPIATQEYQAGVDAYRNNFPGLFEQEANPQGAPQTYADLHQQSVLNNLANWQQRNALLGGGSTPNIGMPAAGPGSSPGEALSAKPEGANDPNFGYTSGPIGPGGSRNTPRSPYQRGEQPTGSQYGTPTGSVAPGYTPISRQGLTPGTHYSPYNGQAPPGRQEGNVPVYGQTPAPQFQAPTYTGGPRPANLGRQ